MLQNLWESLVRDECRQLTRSELDLVMGQLLALTQTDQMTQAKKHSPKERRRSFTCFKHGGHNVCIRTFCFLHTIGRSKFQSIKAHPESNGLCPRHRCCSLWKQLLPQILVCKPMSDLCWTCHQNSTRIMRATQQT